MMAATIPGFLGDQVVIVRIHLWNPNCKSMHDMIEACGRRPLLSPLINPDCNPDQNAFAKLTVWLSKVVERSILRNILIFHISFENDVLSSLFNEAAHARRKLALPSKPPVAVPTEYSFPHLYAVALSAARVRRAVHHSRPRNKIPAAEPKNSTYAPPGVSTVGRSAAPPTINKPTRHASVIGRVK